MTVAQLDEAWLRNARHLHVTGVFPALSANCLGVMRRAMAVMREAGRGMSFDPNLRPMLWSSQDVMRETLNELALQLRDRAARHRGGPGAHRLERPGADRALLPRARRRAGDRQARPGRRVLRRPRRRLRPRAGIPGGAGDRHRRCRRRLRGRRVSALLEGRGVEAAARRGCWIGARAVQVLGDTEGLPTRGATAGGGL